MAFWITTVLLALVVAALFAIALMRRADQFTGAGDYDMRVYRDQLAEVDRDLERGVLTQDDAKRVRTEVSRRILAADAERTVDTDFTRGAPKLVAAVVALVLVGGSLALYKGIGPLKGLGAPGYSDLALADRIAFADSLRETRPSQARAEASLTDLPPVAEFNADYLQLVQTLRDTVAERPDDIQGHALLVQNESNLGNFAAAYRAQGRILDLKGDQATVQDLTDYMDLLVLAAGGYVSPEAEKTARVIFTRDPENGIARYYMGLMMAQTGRPDMALFKFTKAMLVGEKIQVFNYGKHRRDFTYIDDIVEGVIRVLDKPAKPNTQWSSDNPDSGSSQAPWRVFNIGNNSPVELMDYIEAIEEAMGIKAEKELLPLQPGDVPDTFADVDDLVKEFGYKPSMAVKKGVANFVSWYKEFY